MTRVAAALGAASNSLRDVGDPVHQVEAGERHREDAVDARSMVGLDRVLGHGQDDDRDAELRLVDLLDELGALDPALEQGVDQDDVGPELPDRGDDPAPSVRTSSSLTRACALSRPRMYWATCGTSSTMSRRVWSLGGHPPTIPRGVAPGLPTRRSRSDHGPTGRALRA